MRLIIFDMDGTLVETAPDLVGTFDYIRFGTPSDLGDCLDAASELGCASFFGDDFLQVEPLAHFLARLEIGHALGVDLDRVAGARIASDPGVALTRRESAEAAQLHSAALGQLVGYGIEQCAHDAFDFTDTKFRTLDVRDDRNGRRTDDLPERSGRFWRGRVLRDATTSKCRRKERGCRDARSR